MKTQTYKKTTLSRERGHPCPHEREARRKRIAIKTNLEIKKNFFSLLCKPCGQGCPRSRHQAVFSRACLFSFVLFALILFSFQFAFAQSYVYGDAAAENSADAVVTILLAGDKQSYAVGSGLVVSSNGYILTAYHLVKDAREIQVRFRNGETYDKAEIVSTDERRNVVILKIAAANLSIIPNGAAEETQVGSHVYVVANSNGQAWVAKDGLLSAVQLADNVQGAGQGYRVLQFNTTTKENPSGGLLLDERGRTLGIITNKNIAVPLTSILGFIRASTTNTQYPLSSGSTYTPPSPSPTPVLIPQSSVLVPQRGVTPLSAKPPGSVVLKKSTPAEVLKEARTIYVDSYTETFKPEHLVNALKKKPEFNEWGLTFVEERDLADLILTLDHVLFTWKYTFKLYSQRAGVTVATGSVIIWDGNLGAGRMADRVIEKLSKVIASDVKKEESKEEKNKNQEKNK